MALNDRVIIGDGYTFKENGNSIMAYNLKLDEIRNPVITPDGAHVIMAVGGVKIGSTGTINGPVISVHRSYLHNSNEYTPAYGANDFVKMVPVFLDKYQRLGYFPVDNIRIFGHQIQ